MMTASPLQAADTAPALLLAADLQDHLMAANNDLDRLQRLLSDTCDALLASFHGALSAVPAQGCEALRGELHRAVTALQFQDMASQLIHHTQQRLRSCADQVAREAFSDDDEGDESAYVAPPPLRPNPVTQDEMDAGSIELF
ncbi:hypothetical protein [Caldimonas sp. KR1-144]|uniref:hypothetical protein n=1 Tax=Caldimonas sp. KR1-144 TaxID=3400911 RepID=UPI003C01EA29